MSLTFRMDFWHREDARAFNNVQNECCIYPFCLTRPDASSSFCFCFVIRYCCMKCEGAGRLSPLSLLKKMKCLGRPSEGKPVAVPFRRCLCVVRIDRKRTGWGLNLRCFRQLRRGMHHVQSVQFLTWKIFFLLFLKKQTCFMQQKFIEMTVSERKQIPCPWTTAKN